MGRCPQKAEQVLSLGLQNRVGLEAGEVCPQDRANPGGSRKVNLPRKPSFGQSLLPHTQEPPVS